MTLLPPMSQLWANLTAEDFSETVGDPGAAVTAAATAANAAAAAAAAAATAAAAAAAAASSGGGGGDLSGATTTTTLDALALLDDNPNVSVVWTGGEGGEGGTTTWETVTVLVIKSTLMGSIIIVSVMGNVLVIISIGMHHKLQVLTNYFLVSLAIADMLVASCAMTFNASVEISGRWLFGYIMCDLWNSFDVYFSTVSILHLCCISVDRYYAIVTPLEYPLYMTKRTVLFMLANVWLAPTLISFVPIFLGWYATDDHLRIRSLQPDMCTFEVNKVYAILSSAFSFWIPCTVMVILYFRIYQEARKQEAAILSRTNSTCTINNVQRGFPSSTAQQILAALRITRVPRIKKRAKAKRLSQQDIQLGPLPRIAKPDSSSLDQGSGMLPVYRTSNFCSQNLCTNDRRFSKSVVSDTGQLSLPIPHDHTSSQEISPRTGSPDLSVNEEIIEKIELSPKAEFSGGSNSSINGHTGKGLPVRVISPIPFGRHENFVPVPGYSGGGCSSSATASHPVMRREHKAARTLGIIMGAFILCWLPFFTWYVAVTICGDGCPCPQAVVTTLFWIGYFNSTLNPFIYAYFRADFREAFRKTLRQLRCCLRDDGLPGSFV